MPAGSTPSWCGVSGGSSATSADMKERMLAASGDQSSTTMFYVFDVVDASDTRVHRIVGQESAPGSSGDPWSGPNSDTLERAARRAVTELVAWIRR